MKYFSGLICNNCTHTIAQKKLCAQNCSNCAHKIVQIVNIQLLKLWTYHCSNCEPTIAQIVHTQLLKMCSHHYSNCAHAIPQMQYREKLKHMCVDYFLFENLNNYTLYRVQSREKRKFQQLFFCNNLFWKKSLLGIVCLPNDLLQFLKPKWYFETTDCYCSLQLQLNPNILTWWYQLYLYLEVYLYSWL